ncbi:FadR/GntR family transcriptional regulator [uncultured Cohaesibacter sp.]|uniref:FadR/GntR family transcriptional regulator n=1 Tax=uncultured Cohaesibacter sp. TaxID=1002546 RepID=UPI002A0A86DB|nr:FadR/GntR family transcriptional regulator [uncultured Cohaesibacter sp.]
MVMGPETDEDFPMPLRKRGRLHSAVSSVLESRILNGELKVGDRLESESAIAREFGVSTRAVREAIQELEVKGLVQRRHGERTEVVRDDVNNYLDALAVTVRQQFYSDPDYLLQLMSVRRMIESEVLEILTDGDLPKMPKVEAALDAMRLAVEEKDFNGFVDADATFHLELVHATGNQILMHIYDNFSGLINDVIHVTSRVPIKSLSDAYKEHAEIYDQISRRDKAGAKERIRTQIDKSADYLRQAIEQSNLKQSKNEDENG